MITNVRIALGKSSIWILQIEVFFQLYRNHVLNHRLSAYAWESGWCHKSLKAKQETRNLHSRQNTTNSHTNTHTHTHTHTHTEETGSVYNDHSILAELGL
jgi:hypothetical protein